MCEEALVEGSNAALVRLSGFFSRASYFSAQPIAAGDSTLTRRVSCASHMRMLSTTSRSRSLSCVREIGPMGTSLEGWEKGVGPGAPAVWPGQDMWTMQACQVATILSTMRLSRPTY